MSLDFHIKTKTRKILHRGTGVHIRENGQTVELQTLEEVKAHFPDADLSGIAVNEWEDDELLHVNLTHNLTEMAQHVPVFGTDYTAYDLLWHPENIKELPKETITHEDEGWEEERITLTALYRRWFFDASFYISEHRKELERFNPENGWGSYDGLLAKTTEICHCLLNIPNEELNDYYIYCWV